MEIYAKEYYIDKDGKCVIPGGITAIIDHQFAGNYKLKNVIIPESVTEIETFAFSGCNQLKEIKLPKGLKVIGDFAFDNCWGLTEINIPGSVEKIGDGAFFATDLEKITVDAESENFVSIDGVLYDSEKTRLIRCPGRKRGVYGIPNGVKEICPMAFEGCVDITGVVIPGSVTDLGSEAFYGCVNMEKVEMGKNVVKIEEDAFEGCHKLKNIFIPKTVTKIGKRAFPDNPGIEEVKYEGTQSEWKKIKICGNNQAILRIPVICSDGVLPALLG